MSDHIVVISVILASTVPIALIGGLWNRHELRKAGGKGGIGWQFIRYTILTISVPLAALLAINESLTAEAATLIGTALGFAFGKSCK